ncbi:hypothetical protein, partial [Nitrolancea hollandica]|uniref:hypothetical protein n=1 Tax=Nitrolancea hollandica TaxID=1206749 RepID=UPI00058C71E5
MPDRVLGRAGDIRVDIPWLTGQAVTVTVTDPLDTVVINTAQTTYVSSGRYRYPMTGSALSRQGIWTAVW